MSICDRCLKNNPIDEFAHTCQPKGVWLKGRLEGIAWANQQKDEKYKKLLAFVKWCDDSNGCSLIDGIDCVSCKALEVLREIGEE